MTTISTAILGLQGYLIMPYHNNIQLEYHLIPGPVTLVIDIESYGQNTQAASATPSASRIILYLNIATKNENTARSRILL